MKLSTLSAKLTCIKSYTVRSLAVLTLAGAALSVAAPHAAAQRFSFGVQVGGPSYIAGPGYVAGPRYVAPPVPYGPAYGGAYYGPRYNGWREHEEWRRRQEWQRFHHEPYRYDGGPRAYGYRPY